MVPTRNNIRVVKSTRMSGRGMWQSKWENRNAYGVFVGTPEGKRLRGRTRHKRDSKIKIDLNEDGTTWTGLI